MFNKQEVSEYNIKKIINDYIKNDFITNELYTFINDNQLYISGSLIHKHLSESTYDIYDIDIFIENKSYDEKLYINFFKLLGLELTLSDYNNYYNFNPNIIRCLYFTDIKELIRINIIVVSMPIEEFIEFEYPFNFLKNYYYDNSIYKIADGPLLSENIYEKRCLETQYHSIMQKYIDRGIILQIKGVQNSRSTDKIDPDNLIRMINMYNLLGFTVIPLDDHDKFNHGKNPKPALWVDLESDYRFSINEKNPDNIGIVCGENSGIICIDVDKKNNGVYHFQKMVNKYGLPNGPYQMTPNDGFHYIFRYNQEKMQNMKSKIKCIKYDNDPVGIDLWIKNVQFVVEPSINRKNNRKYKWQILPTKDNIPELPDWVYDMYNSNSFDSDYNFDKPIIPETSFSWFTKLFS